MTLAAQLVGILSCLAVCAIVWQAESAPTDQPGVHPRPTRIVPIIRQGAAP